MGLNKRALLRGAFGVLGGALVGCGREDAKVLGVIPKGRSHFFWTNIHAGAAPECKTSGLHLIWHGPQKENDMEAQREIAARMLRGRCKAVAIAPIDEKILVPILEFARARNKWVFVFDSISTGSGICGSVATDNRAAGALAAKEVVERTKGIGTVAILGGTLGSRSTMDREQGFKEYLKGKAPAMKIVAERSGGAEIRTGLEAAKQLLTSRPTALFTSNESGTVAALHARKFQGQKNNYKPIHVGFDWTPDLLEALREQEISALIVQDPNEIGKKLVSMVAKYTGHQAAARHSLQPLAVTPENLDTPQIQKRLNPGLATT